MLAVVTPAMPKDISIADAVEKAIFTANNGNLFSVSFKVSDAAEKAVFSVQYEYPPPVTIHFALSST